MGQLRRNRVMDDHQLDQRDYTNDNLLFHATLQLWFPRPHTAKSTTTGGVAHMALFLNTVWVENRSDDNVLRP